MPRWASGGAVSVPTAQSARRTSGSHAVLYPGRSSRCAASVPSRPRWESWQRSAVNCCFATVSPQSQRVRPRRSCGASGGVRGGLR